MKELILSCPKCALVLIFAFGLLTSVSTAQLRVVDYNTAGDVRAGMNTVLAAIGGESINGIAKPIDVLALQEQDSMATTAQGIVNVLNGIYGPGTYARGFVDAGTSGAGRPGIVFNTQTVQLVSETVTGTVSSSGNARQGMMYRLHPLGYGADADLYVFSNHYKAGDTATDKSRRNVEAQSVRTLGNALGAGANIIYAGDYNVQSASEASIQTIIAPGTGQAVDPIDLTMINGSPVTWRDVSSLRYAHSQSPVDASLPGVSGLTTGGMDDRFDFQYVSSVMMDGEGLSYIGPGVGNSAASTASYHVFGNNGTHPLNGTINNPSNTAQPANVLTALASVTDHLPVVADYQVPARMSVGVTSPPAKVIIGADLMIGINIANSANVAVALGADELDYSIHGAGALTGAIAGTDAALGGGNNHVLAADTVTAGGMSGSILVTSMSQAVANGSFNQAITYDVLAHSNASFDAVSDVSSLAVNIGDFFLGSGVKSVPVPIHNLLSVADYTAGLDVLSSVGVGDTDKLSLDLLLAQIAAGSQEVGLALLDTSTAGSFAAHWTISTVDENLLGATAGADLVLELTGRVTILGDVNFDGSVNIFDINFVSTNWGLAGPSGDANSDGAVNIFDINLISSNWTPTGSGTTTAVPEPPTLVLLIFAVAGWCVRRVWTA